VLRDGGPDPRKIREIWRKALHDGNSTILKERLGKDVKSVISCMHQREWNPTIVKDLQAHRRRDKVFDCKMAMLVYYNKDIGEEEMQRRWRTLDMAVVWKAVEYCNALATAPKPEGWHKGRTLLSLRKCGTQWIPIGGIEWKRSKRSLISI
jgi:hypothetical protein